MLKYLGRKLGHWRSIITFTFLQDVYNYYKENTVAFRIYESSLNRIYKNLWRNILPNVRGILFSQEGAAKIEIKDKEVILSKSLKLITMWIVWGKWLTPFKRACRKEQLLKRRILNESGRYAERMWKGVGNDVPICF